MGKHSSSILRIGGFHFFNKIFQSVKNFKSNINVRPLPFGAGIVRE
jgi:hypothetical protein